MSLLGLSNRIIFQWFCVRLTKHQEERIESFNFASIDLIDNGSFASRGTGKTVKYQWYSIQYWIVPTTGWNSDYKYINGKPKFFRITKDKKVL